MSSTADELGKPQPSVVTRLAWSISLQYQHFLDRATPFVSLRWASTLVLLCIYALRVYYIQGFYIVTYALAIFLLNQFIGFLTPQMDPAVFVDEDDEGPTLPTRNDEEFKPFMRRLPEFKFWTSTTRAILIATICTFFEAFDVPVFWPILVVYFILLFVMTMRRQIEHMIRYRYIPFTYGKRKYKGKQDSGKVVIS